MRKLLVAVLLAFFVLTVSAQDTAELPILAGKIAYIGTDNNVYVAQSLDGQMTYTALTTDADPMRHYQWVTWATDGRLAYFCCDIRFQNRPFKLEAYISGTGDTRGKLIYEQEDEGFTYAYWSPSNCDTGERCRDLAVLITRPNEAFKVELIRDSIDSPSTRTAGTGTPFYISWSPDGAKMVWQRDSRIITLYDVQSDSELQTLGATIGVMQAPVWSPIDDRFLLTVNDGANGSNIAVSDGESITILREGVFGLIGLSWSPDGRYIAYSSLLQNGESVLAVLDATNGAVVNVLRTTFLISYFWSPDSSKIAYISPTFADTQGASVSLVQQNTPPRLTWSVFDVTTGANQRYASWLPSDEMLYLMTYFDQFAQSHRVWSPDSRYLVYGVTDDRGLEQVIILDTSASDTLTYTLAEGRIGIWSYE